MPSGLTGPGHPRAITITRPTTKTLNYATVPVPFNWLSAMGRALWTSHLLTGNSEPRDRAVRLAHYCNPSNARWGLHLGVLPATGVRHLSKQWNEVFSEHTGHAALSLTFPIRWRTTAKSSTPAT